jgi:hypothetical protein
MTTHVCRRHCAKKEYSSDKDVIVITLSERVHMVHTHTHILYSRLLLHIFGWSNNNYISLRGVFFFLAMSAMQLQKLCHFNFSWTYLVSVTTLALLLKCVTILHLVLKFFISLAAYNLHQFINSF